MENDDPLLSSYKFFFDDGLNNVYYFSTVNSIAYEVQLKPSPYVFGETPFANDVFELVLKVIDAPEGVRPPLDSRTSVTVATIVKDFYDRSDLTITIYLCDTSDRRQKARWYKFNRWYDYFSATDYQRYDRAVFDDKDGVLYHCAVIIKSGNPYRMDVFNAFNRLIEGYNEPK